ncbi:hypothetical protein [Clavibacter californiensis]|uniref:hypothetical protein n=1 Tax=Clavibacter californiensis TaxID=1401995 RepID=UPI0011B06654|nr:hypothetical protein [Clavibacter californiensis]UKF80574.1 hypothetical protein FGD68_02670 [Clavibacter californiensis]
MTPGAIRPARRPRPWSEVEAGRRAPVVEEARRDVGGRQRASIGCGLGILVVLSLWTSGLSWMLPG